MRRNMSNDVARQVGGFTLIEVLIAIVVFSLGLLGLLAGAALAMRNNQDAYVSSQGVNIIDGLLAGMRQNRRAFVTAGLPNPYNGTFTAIDISVSVPAAACVGTTCTPAQMAAADIDRARVLMGQYLPQPSNIVINCTAQPNLATIAGLSRSVTPFPFDGTCDVAIGWPADRGGVNQVVRSWTVQP